MVHFNVSLGSSEEISEAYRQHVLSLVSRACAAEEARRRASERQKKIPPPPIPSDKIQTQLGEPSMYNRIKATIPPHFNAETDVSVVRDERNDCWPHVASNPACSSSRGYDQTEISRNVSVYTQTPLGNSVVGKLNVPGSRFTGENFPFRNVNLGANKGTSIRPLIPRELERATDEEVALFLREKREKAEKERAESTRPMSVAQGAQFLADKLKLPRTETPPHETGQPPKDPVPKPVEESKDPDQPQPRKRKRKVQEEAKSEDSATGKPDEVVKEKEVEVKNADEKEEKPQEEQTPAKRQKTASRARRTKRAPTPKPAKEPEDPKEAAQDDLDVF